MTWFDEIVKKLWAGKLEQGKQTPQPEIVSPKEYKEYMRRLQEEKKVLDEIHNESLPSKHQKGTNP